MFQSITNALKEDRNETIKNILSSILILCFFTLSYHAPTFDRVHYGLTVNTLAFVGIWWISRQVKKWLNKFSFTVMETMLQFLLAAFFSFASVLGRYFEASFYHMLKKGISQVVLQKSTMFAFLGGCVFFFLVIRLIWTMALPKDDLRESKPDFFDRFFNKNLYRNCIVVMVICWLPQYIIRFPGVLTFDNWHSLAMHLGHQEVTTKHPLIWNAIIGNLTDFGVLIGVNWFAIFFITLIHHICAMVLIPYTLSTIKKMGGSNKLLAAFFAFFVILPPMYIYASTVYNDFLFGLSFLLLSVEFVYYLYDRKNYFSAKHLLLTALAVCGTFLRYNGLYVIILTFVVVVLRELCYLLKIEKKFRFVSLISLIIVFVLPIIGGLWMQTSLKESYDAKSLTSRAMLAMPIQQTVRCLKEHGSEIPKEEHEAIHAVLTWTDKKYAEEYYSRNFDNVKESFKTDASKEEIFAFLKAWTKLLRLYPETCFMATAQQTYYLFCPFVKNTRYYYSTKSCSNLIEPRTGMDPSPYIFSVPLLEKYCKKLGSFLTSKYPRIPIIGLTVSQGAYTLLMFAISLALLFKKDKRALVLMVPMFVILGTTFLGPAVYNHPRYTYPIMYCMPVLLFTYLLSNQKRGKNMSDKKQVGVITFHNYDNYGAILQSYALQQKLEELGTQPEIIDYNCKYISNPFRLERLRNKGLFNYIYGIIGYFCYIPRRIKCNAFRKKIKYSEPFTSKTLKNADGKYDIYISGSDQIWDWNLTGFDKAYFLDFVTEGKKCSYAASIGENLPTEEHREKYAMLLKNFDNILMRESYGADVVEELIGHKPECACDPTLLLTADEWETVMAKPIMKKPYILVYQLGVNTKLVDFTKKLKKTTGLDVVYVPFPLVGALKCRPRIFDGPSEWLRLFKDAQYVVTDSFHGAVFSILFHKKFYIYANGHHINKRVDEFLKRLNLTECVIDGSSSDEIPFPDINYDFVDSQLDKIRGESMENLKKIID